MARIFLSYSSQDINLATELGQKLIAHNCSVWRDQESIYGGQSWPKAIGEALAANDFVLLVWSKNAKKAHFVEFEWSTAIALRKRIIPYLLDDTPLSPSLKKFQGIPFDNLETDLPKILKAFEVDTAPSDEKRTAMLIEKLDELRTPEPEDAIKTVRNIAQHVSNVKGDVIQAGRDVIVHKTGGLSKRTVWGLGLPVTLLMMIILLVVWQNTTTGATYYGVVFDENENGVPGAEIEIKTASNATNIIGKNETLANGEFEVLVDTKPGSVVWVRISKEGFKDFSGMKSLNGNDVIILTKIGK